MTKSKTDTKKPDDKKAEDKKDKHDGGWRETVESIAMAVILALLFRGFVAEAFVIPTGSMAPTLRGRHKDVWCPKCNYQYQTSASDERDEDRLTGKHVIATTCPICRYTQQLDLFGEPNDHSMSGDRIIVAKFAYDLGEPQRWDVIVFKFPGNAVQNYIKRLVGLPGERVLITGGNVYVRGLNEPEEALRIARKPPHKLNALLQLVHDTDYIPAELTAVGWPLRWSEWTRDGSRDIAWKAEDGGKAYATSGQHDHDAWLRYRHLIPRHEDWRQIELREQLPAGVESREGKLISDFYAYNARSYVPQGRPFTNYLQRGTYDPSAYDPQAPGPGREPDESQLGQHWVDDLAVECLAEVTGDEGELLLDLVRGGVHHECRINLADGQATLRRIDADGSPLPFAADSGKEVQSVTAATSVQGPGSYRLRLSNADHEVLLWVNGSVVQFDGPTTYESEELIDPVWSPVDPGDLAPAGIGSRGAAVRLSQLRIFRDKYYIASEGESDDYDGIALVGSSRARHIQEVLADPSLWNTSGMFVANSRRAIWFDLQEVPTDPGKDQFLPLGDNSPASSDGRYWSGHNYVERDLLIGKALLIYWPHTWNRPIPFWPNFQKMGPIR
jgi:signal peptidase I